MILKEEDQGQWSIINTKIEHTFPLRDGNTTKARLAVLKTRKMDGQRFPIHYQEYGINGSQITTEQDVQMSRMLWEVHRSKLLPYELLRKMTEINKAQMTGNPEIIETAKSSCESYIHLGFVEDYEITLTSKNVQILRHLMKTKRAIIVICGTEAGTSIGTDQKEGAICQRKGTYIRIGMLEVRVEKKKSIIRDYKEFLIYNETIFYPIENQLQATAYRIYYYKYHPPLRERINGINKFQSIFNGQANKLREPLILNCQTFDRERESMYRTRPVSLIEECRSIMHANSYTPMRVGVTFTTRYQEANLAIYHQEYLVQGNQTDVTFPQYGDKVYGRNKELLSPLEYRYTDIRIKAYKAVVSTKILKTILGNTTNESTQRTTPGIKKIQRIKNKISKPIFVIIIAGTLATLVAIAGINLHLYYRRYQRRKRDYRKRKLTGGKTYTPPKGPQNLIQTEIEREIEENTQARTDHELRDIATRDGTLIGSTNLPRMSTRLRTLQYPEFQRSMWAINDETITPRFGHRPNTIGTFV